MKKYILLFLWCIPLSLLAQNIERVEYFFDTDPGYGNAIEISINPAKQLDINTTISVASLENGFHVLFVRAMDEHMVWSTTHIRSFLKENLQEDVSPDIAYLEYFIDADPGYGNATSVTLSGPSDIAELNFTVDLTDVSNGYHTVFFRARDSYGNWSSVFNRPFVVGIDVPDVTYVEYFFDTDPGFGNATPIEFVAFNRVSISVDLDLSDAESGFHTMYVRAQDANDSWSQTFNHSFIKESLQTDALPVITKAEYFVDADPGYGAATDIPLSNASNQAVLEFVADISGYDVGNHIFLARAQDENGAWSIVYSKEFTISDGPFAEDTTLTMFEDDTLYFNAELLRYTNQQGEDLAKIKVVGLPDAGMLLLSSTAVVLDQEIVVDDIPQLMFIPAENANGLDYTSMKLLVGDSDEWSIAENEITFNVEAINDAPAFTLSSTGLELEPDFPTTETITVTASVVPDDELGETVTFSLNPASVDFANVSIDAATGEVTITSVTGGDGTQVFQVIADDGGLENSEYEQEFTLTVNPPCAYTIDVSITQEVSCQDGDDGAIEVSVTETGTFEYSLDGVTFQTGSAFTGLTPADYVVVVKDADGCEDESATVTLTNPTDSTWYVDADGDGFGDAGTTMIACEEPEGYANNDEDCDDSDELINPETFWYADTDGDGYGDESTSLQSCTQPAGYVINSIDCDDTDELINPDLMWYADSDADGYGDPEISMSSCLQPDNYVSNSDDCDDTDVDVNPELIWYADADADTYGDAEATLASCTQPTGYVADMADCDDTDADVYPGAPALADGKDNDCDGILDKVNQEITFGSIEDQDDDGSSITLAASSSSGLTVSYSVTGPVTLSGTVLTLTGAGVVTVTATQTGDDGYEAAEPVEQSFCVNPVPEITTEPGTSTELTLVSNYATGNQWLLEDEEITLATGQKHDVLFSGNYTVEVDIEGCVAISEPYSVILTGLPGLDSNIPMLYPNPVTSVLIIETNNKIYDKLRIVNLAGNLIREIPVEVSRIELDVSNLAYGVYLLQLSSENGSDMLRFIKR